MQLEWKQLIALPNCVLFFFHSSRAVLVGDCPVRAAFPEPLATKVGHVSWLLPMACEQKWSGQFLSHLLKWNLLALTFCSFPLPPGIVTLDTSFGRWQSCHQPEFLNGHNDQNCLLAEMLTLERNTFLCSLSHMSVRSLLKATYSLALSNAALKFCLICMIKRLFFSSLFDKNQVSILLEPMFQREEPTKKIYSTGPLL